MIDETHAPQRRSWIASANGHADFPIQNLPFGVFTPPGGAARGGVAIGDDIFDLAAAIELGLFGGLAAQAAQAGSGATLNPLFALAAMRAARCGAASARFSTPTGATAAASKPSARGSSIPPAIAGSNSPPPSATTPTSSRAFT